MKERKVYSREFKHRAASMLIDDDCSVQEVCASLDISATALRRWVDQVRKEQKGQPVANGWSSGVQYSNWYSN